MTDKPIIFNAHDVRAILDGRKTVTRRVIKGLGDDVDLAIALHRGKGKWLAACDKTVLRVHQPPSPGDTLWVREAFALVGTVDPGWLLYRASGYENECRRHGFDCYPDEASVPWKPSIHMPRWVSRITLEVASVRPERLQDITEADAEREGVQPVLVPPDGGSCPHIEGFRKLWDSLYAKRPERQWTEDPWVWRVEFVKQEGK